MRYMKRAGPCAEPECDDHVYARGLCKYHYGRRNYVRRRRESHGARYRALAAVQGHRCAICGADEPRGGSDQLAFAIDHCHATGADRGLLCNPCNRGLGLFKDCPELLEAAAAYLRKMHATVKGSSPARTRR